MPRIHFSEKFDGEILTDSILGHLYNYEQKILMDYYLHQICHTQIVIYGIS